MLNQRWRPVLYCLLGVVLIWSAAMVTYRVAKNSRMTAAKVGAYVDSVNLNSLSAAERAKAIRDLAAKLNALSLDERRKARFERSGMRWFEQMSEEEKATFIELTMPTGFKQMLNAFEQMPEDKRRRAVDDAVRRLRESHNRLEAGAALMGGERGTNAPPPLSPELQAKIRTLGLKSFYTQSSAETKAELAPVLEELQRAMESGRYFHR